MPRRQQRPHQRRLRAEVEHRRAADHRVDDQDRLGARRGAGGSDAGGPTGAATSGSRRRARRAGAPLQPARHGTSKTWGHAPMAHATRNTSDRPQRTMPSVAEHRTLRGSKSTSASPRSRGPTQPSPTPTTAITSEMLDTAFVGRAGTSIKRPGAGARSLGGDGWWSGWTARRRCGAGEAGGGLDRRRRRRRRPGERQGGRRGGRRHRGHARPTCRAWPPTASCRSSGRSPSARCATSCCSSSRWRSC